jgi:3-oxoacyl-[acyl-carrier-protein] synthase II
MKKRVVVTGLGPVSPIGTGKEAFWEALISGRSGARRIRFEQYDMEQYGSQIACTVEGFSVTDFIQKSKDLKYLGRTSEFALAGTKLALQDAGFELQFMKEDRSGRYTIRGMDLEKTGVIIGAGGENMDLAEKWFRNFLRHDGPKRLSPFALPHAIVSSVPVVVSIKYGLKGTSFVVPSACASSNHALIEAYKQILVGDETVMISGGAEACITPFVFGGFDALNAMSMRNEEPEKGSRPFDKDRDGFVMGEGAGIIVLEELNHALERGAHIYCELTGYGTTSDAYHITAPDPGAEMQAKAMKEALRRAGAAPEEIDYINAHGTSTPMNDVTETVAIKKALGQQAYQVPISSTKSMTGHLIGGAGGVEAVATALSIERGIIHATINLDAPGEDCDLNYVPNKAIERPVRKAISNGFGFGGLNAVIVLERFER